LHKGDLLVVWLLDRLGLSLKHLIELMTELEKQKIGFQSLQECIDTTMPGGRLMLHIFGALAEFERNLISERTRAGLEAARTRGRKRGRRSCCFIGTEFSRLGGYRKQSWPLISKLVKPTQAPRDSSPGR
jgi:DNA invertase Pin-like site-specific DNA recombinase